MVELTVQEMLEGGEAMCRSGLSFLVLLSEDPSAGGRLYTPAMIDRLVPWIAKWLLKVRKMVVGWGKIDVE